jgi:hypothetical protein
MLTVVCGPLTPSILTVLLAAAAAVHCPQEEESQEGSEESPTSQENSMNSFLVGDSKSLTIHSEGSYGGEQGT